MLCSPTNCCFKLTIEMVASWSPHSMYIIPRAHWLKVKHIYDTILKLWRPTTVLIVEETKVHVIKTNVHTMSQLPAAFRPCMTNCRVYISRQCGISNCGYTIHQYLYHSQPGITRHTPCVCLYQGHIGWRLQIFMTQY
jgi:hypothetical protein